MLTDPLAQTIEAYNRISEPYTARWFEWRALEPFVEKFLAALPNNGPILDAGCGCGREIRYLSGKEIDGLPVDCVGIDLSLGLISQARSRFESGIFRVMDLRRPEFPDSLFSGIICFAVWNHFFEEDIFDALVAFRRIIRSNGIVAITIKMGSGQEVDNYGRVTKYYEADEILRYFREYGFSIEQHIFEDDSDGRTWLQVLARCEQKPDTDFDAGCAFCMTTPLPENRSQNYPVAGSILWGDRHMFCTIDCAPLVEGHLLLITGKHHYSYMSSDIANTKIREHKDLASAIFERAYGAAPTFLEHGTISGGSGSASCIEHAHIHALPLKRGLKTIIERSVGKLIAYRDNEIMRGVLGSKAYVLYEDRKGEIFVRSDGIENLESQFFRIVVGEAEKIKNPKWGSAIHDSVAQFRFRRTLSALIPILDALQLEKPIFSRITETRRTRLFTQVAPKEKDQESSPIIAELRARFDSKMTLLDLGEKDITEQLIYKVFDPRERKNKLLGDDAAVIPLMSDINSVVVSTDACPTPIIFNFEPANYRYYGWLSLVVSISDLAAMGAEPLGALLSCEMPEKMKVLQFIDFLEGAAWAADRFQCPVVGGNIKDARRFNVTSTAFGTTKNRKPLQRLGAVPGHDVYAIGNMGYLWAAILNRQFKAIIPSEAHTILENCLKYPSPNLGAGLYLSNLEIIGACMDASDGPSGALVEIAEKNKVDMEIDIQSLQVPFPVAEVARQLNLDPKVLMFTWGNWELVFTADPKLLNPRLRDNPMKDEVIRLGSVVEGAGIVKIQSSGKILPDLSSKRFSKSSSFSHGLQGYLKNIAMTKF